MNKKKIEAKFDMNKFDTIAKCYKVPREEIGFISAVLDSYEGLATVRTLDNANGYIEIWVNPFFENEVENIIEDLKKEILIERYN